MTTPTPLANLETPSTRGRGQQPSRRRSGSRTRGGGRNYGSASVQQEAREQQQRIQTILDENEQRSKQSRGKKEDVSEYIEQGKALVSRFFKGFEQEKRGNIQVTLDDTLPERVAESYLERLDEHASDRFRSINDQNQRETKKRRTIKRFVAGITLATAIKLYRSSTDLEKTSNFSLNILHQSKVILPEKAAVIINQLGKTDLKDDNRIRIVDQNMAAKRMLVKSVCRYHDSAKLAPLLAEAANNNLNVDHLYAKVFSDDFCKMIDNKLSSLKMLRDIGREYFIEASKQDYEVTCNSVTVGQNAQPVAQVRFKIRLPKFNFNAENLKQELQTYLANPIFSLAANRHFSFDNNIQNGQAAYQQLVVNVVCCLVFQIAEPGWIRDPNRDMATIDNDFANTFIAGATFLNVMNQVGVWNINNFINDADLNELGSEVLNQWNTTDCAYLRQVLKMKEIAFSEFGTDSQMVEIPQDAIMDTKFEGVNRYGLKRKPESKVGLKISETGAIFGVMSKFIKRMRISSDFKIVHDSNNKNILREFLKSDFIN